MSYEPASDPVCDVCGRRLLPGEREARYVNREGTEASVCELCKSRAEEAGWVPADRVSQIGPVGRERRRSRGSDLLGGFFGKRSVAPSQRRGQHGAPDAAAPEGHRAGSGARLNVASAVAAFNASSHRRTVAGLGRTLGSPRASGLLIKTSAGTPGARLTVAWELTWYQWEVAPGKRGLEVRESGKGDLIDQLRAADRTWNLEVGDDGTLSEHTAEGEAT